MAEALREIEGTWEQVAAHGLELAGKRVYLRVVETNGAENDDDTAEVVIPLPPGPTLEQAALGIRPAAIGNGTFEDIMRLVAKLRSDEAEEGGGLWDAIAEERAKRRQWAQEKQD